MDAEHVSLFLASNVQLHDLEACPQPPLKHCLKFLKIHRRSGTSGKNNISKKKKEVMDQKTPLSVLDCEQLTPESGTASTASSIPIQKKKVLERCKASHQ